IQALGRTTGAELRDLSKVGIPVFQLLADAMGVTTAQAKEMVSDGLVPADVALNAIVSDFETFGDAAARQATSIGGLISSLADLGPMLARNLFGPADEATGKVEGIFGALQTRLASLVDILSSEVFNEGLANIGRTLGGYAEAALVWGENIVNSFAQGMFNAIGSILDALTTIGSLLAFWLSPGSPPRLLPNLDEWGAGAMTEYMRGWEKADFSVFDSLTNTIESFLRSLSKDVIGEVDLVPTIIGSRESIAAAIAELDSTGQIAESTLARVMASMGGAGRQVEGFLRSMFALEQANAAVEAAQDNLNRVTAEYDALLKPLDDKIEGLDNAQENLRDTMRISQLELIANDPNATAGEKALARMEIEKLRAKQSQRLLLTEKKNAVNAAQATLDAEKIKQEQAQAAFDQQKALIAVQTENNKLLLEQIKLLEKLAK
ncbi:MAG: tape measure protein, partial [Acidobacteria bacterium]|nr:tape measure protein [Acidobacteriota bacterium]